MAAVATLLPHSNGHSPLPTDGAIVTSLTFSKGSSDGKPLIYKQTAQGMETNVTHDDYKVQIRDLRALPQPLSLKANGIQLEKLTVPDDLDFTNEEEVKNVYIPLAEQLIKKVTGATRVHTFDSTVRIGKAKHDEALVRDVQNTRVRRPVPQMHVDFSLKSGHERLHQVLPDEAEALSKTPFAIVQIWRPIRPVDESPLAVIDAQSVDPADLLEVRLEIPSDNIRSRITGNVGHTYSVKHNSGQRVYYAKAMTTDEALLFKTYDSRNGVARFVPHAGFKDPNTTPGAPNRESIELRAYAFWESEAPQDIALQH